MPLHIHVCIYVRVCVYNTLSQFDVAYVCGFRVDHLMLGSCPQKTNSSSLSISWLPVIFCLGVGPHDFLNQFVLCFIIMLETHYLTSK